jgi:hypothetical protein
MALLNLSVKFRGLRWLVVAHQVNISNLQLARLSIANAIWGLSEPFLRLLLLDITQELLNSRIIHFLILFHHVRHTFQLLFLFLDIKQSRW